MIEKQLKYADHCIEILNKSFPRPESLDYWYEGESYKGAESVIKILLSENWIEEVGLKYKLNPSTISILKKHNSYSNHGRNQQEKEDRAERKEIFDFRVSKWKYHTFWWFFALAIFGGGYSAYDFITNLTKNKAGVHDSTSIKQTELLEPHSKTTISDKKNYNTVEVLKTHNDSLTIE